MPNDRKRRKFSNRCKRSHSGSHAYAWVAIVTSASKVSYDHQQRRSIVSSRILCLLISAELPEKHIEKMKRLLIVSLFLVQSCMVFAQNSCMNDTVVRDFQFPLTQKETEPVFYYFNNEWIALPDHAVIQADSIQKAEVKNDEYGNRAVFLTVTPTYLMLKTPR